MILGVSSVGEPREPEIVWVERAEKPKTVFETFPGAASQAVYKGGRCMCRETENNRTNLTLQNVLA